MSEAAGNTFDPVFETLRRRLKSIAREKEEMQEALDRALKGLADAQQSLMAHGREEALIRAAIVKLGGDPDAALPSVLSDVRAAS